MEFIESIMDENYTLVWVDYRESLMRTETYYRNALKTRLRGSVVKG